MNKKTVISKISARTGVHKSVIDLVFKGLYETILSELQKGKKENTLVFKLVKP